VAQDNRVVYQYRAKMNKKAQGISINVIIITAIALIVLVVLVFALAGRTTKFNEGLGTCKGFCADSAVQCGDNAPVPTKNCNDGDRTIDGDGYCCIG
jgi:hypothetical protein